MTGFSALGITWTPHPMTGWGNYGIQLCKHAARTQAFELVPLGDPPDQAAFEPALFAELAPHLMARERVLMQTSALEGRVRLDHPVMHALLNGFTGLPAAERFKGRPDIGAIFLEDAGLSDADLDRARAFDLIIAGSAWNEQVLRRFGLTHTRTLIQGIDPQRFFPGPKPGAFAGRFCVFSGGKLEYRKGQDILIAAFRRFARRHQDALLVTAWQNIWPHSVHGIGHQGHVRGVPAQKPDGQQDMAGWLAANGIDSHQVVDLGLVPNSFMGRIYRDMDVAVFPNRCEGGTNLVAMEAQACGVPCILSANTGHLDLLEDEICLPLHSQGPVTGGPAGADQWGESSVEEVEAALEWVYAHRDAAAELGARAARRLAGVTWERQLTRLLEIISGV